MTDSGKHSAIRQTSDGSFEIVFDRSGLQEVSEDEVSFAEEVVPEPRQTQPRTSSRVLLFSVLGVAALLLVAAIGWYAMGQSKDRAVPVDEVPGFRPYGGGGEAAARPTSPNKARAAQIAAAAAAADEEDEEAAPAEEITESEPGWELSEVTEPEVEVEVEIEPVPPVVEVEAPPEEVAEAEVPEEVGEDEDEDSIARQRMFSGRRGLNALRGADIGRNLKAPRIPDFNANPLAAKRLQQVPIRNIPSVEGDGEEVEEEGEDGEEGVEEEGEEEILEEE